MSGLPEAEEKRKPSTRPLTKVLSIADKDECKSIFLTAFRRLGRLSFSSPCALGDVHS